VSAIIATSAHTPLLGRSFMAMLPGHGRAVFQFREIGGFLWLVKMRGRFNSETVRQATQADLDQFTAALGEQGANP